MSKQPVQSPDVNLVPMGSPTGAPSGSPPTLDPEKATPHHNPPFSPAASPPPRNPRVPIIEPPTSLFEDVFGSLLIVFSSLVFLLFLGLPFVQYINIYERAVILRLGRLRSKKAFGPGLIYLLPGVDQIFIQDIREVVVDVARQSVVSKDMVSIEVNAIISYRIHDPVKAILEIEDCKRATIEYAQTALRAIIGRTSLEELLTNLEMVNRQLLEHLDYSTDPFGIAVSQVQIKDIKLPPSMVRALAVVAEAGKNKEGKVIHAEGELDASRKLALAAKELEQSPASIFLRYLQTITDIGQEQNTSLILPLPMEMLRFFGSTGGYPGLPASQGNFNIVGASTSGTGAGAESVPGSSGETTSLMS